ncbi:hypothetical protein [Catenulispora subtropica]|uniref:Uncharacterized protein n=1 Tax=Catenulispora subtropica TaxID=450798 RepID=A0ABN2SE40_9ACTN
MQRETPETKSLKHPVPLPISLDTNVGTAMSKIGFFTAAAGLAIVSAATISAPTTLMAGFGWDSPAPTAATVVAASPAGFGWDGSAPTTTLAAAPVAAVADGFGWD